MTNKKNIAISGYYGFENFGDEAILKVLTSELKKQGYGITVFSKSPQNTSEKLGVNSVYRFSIKEVLQTIKTSDLLISGGGSLLQDTTSLKSLLYYLFIIGSALFCKKEVVIFAQGLGPINSLLGKFLTKILLKKAKYITVRDEKSLNLLKKWGLSPDLVSDPVWSLEVKETVNMNRVGIQLRSWKTLSQKYITKLAESIARNFPDKELYIYSFQDALDLELCKNFEAQLKLANPNIRTKLINNLTIDETIQSFSNLDYLIGMRYHACLLALKYGIPTLALSYDEKVEKIAKRFSLPCSFLNENENIEQMIQTMKNLNPKDIKEKAKECLFDFEKIIREIEK